jgi:hypothetical protein
MLFLYLSEEPLEILNEKCVTLLAEGSVNQAQEGGSWKAYYNGQLDKPFEYDLDKLTCELFAVAKEKLKPRPRYCRKQFSGGNERWDIIELQAGRREQRVASGLTADMADEFIKYLENKAKEQQ